MAMMRSDRRTYARSGQADALGAELAGRSASAGVSALVRTQRAELVAHPISAESRRSAPAGSVGTAPSITCAGAPSSVMSHRLHRWCAALHVSGLIIDPDVAGAGDTGPAHAARDHGRVAGHAAPGGQNALGRVHAVNVFRAGLDPDQDHACPPRRGFRLIGVETRCRRRARASRQAAPDDVRSASGRASGAAADPAAPDRSGSPAASVDQAFVDMSHGDLQRRLAVVRLPLRVCSIHSLLAGR